MSDTVAEGGDFHLRGGFHPEELGLRPVVTLTAAAQGADPPKVIARPAIGHRVKEGNFLGVIDCLQVVGVSAVILNPLPDLHLV